jgi:hypothetical protein
MTMQFSCIIQQIFIMRLTPSSIQEAKKCPTTSHLWSQHHDTASDSERSPFDSLTDLSSPRLRHSNIWRQPYAFIVLRFLRVPASRVLNRNRAKCGPHFIKGSSRQTWLINPLPTLAFQSFSLTSAFWHFPCALIGLVGLATLSDKLARSQVEIWPPFLDVRLTYITRFQLQIRQCMCQNPQWCPKYPSCRKTTVLFHSIRRSRATPKKVWPR